MGRAKDSLKHQIRTAALTGITDSDSLRAYKRACDAFSVWGKEQGIRNLQEVSQDVIQRYADYLASRPEEYTAALLRRWDNGHMEMRKRDTGRYRAARRAFCEAMTDSPYLLRGENREKAIRLGLPTEYNRLALMAVSVFHLSHWRLDVTVTNYLIQ